MFVRNYYSCLSLTMFSKGSVVVDVNGNDYTVNAYAENIASKLPTVLTAYNNSGVVFGNGTNPVSLTDYKLSGDIITGFVYSHAIQTYYESDKMISKVLYTITNTSSEGFTISEIALIGAPVSGICCMLERTLLDTPITIDAGGVGQVTYTLSYSIPYVEFGVDIDVSGAYGVEWQFGNTRTVLNRIGDAKLFGNPTPATSYTASGSSPFDAVMPWAGMKRYNVVNGAITFSEDNSGFSETDYDTVVYIPEFYYAAQCSTDRQIWRWAISTQELPGFVKHPGSGRYVGRFHTSNISNVHSSRSGYTPISSGTRPSFRSNSHSKGSNWWQLDIATWSALQLLYLVEFANWNSQDTLGFGNNTGSVLSTGHTTGALYHTIKCSGNSNQYRWVENPISNICTWVDGIMNSNDATTYVSVDNATFADSISALSSTDVRYSLEQGYATKIAFCDKFPWLFLARSIGGSASTYVTDAYRSAANYFPCVGGDCSSDSTTYQKYGFFYSNIYWNATETPSNTGARLIYIP